MVTLLPFDSGTFQVRNMRRLDTSPFSNSHHLESRRFFNLIISSPVPVAPPPAGSILLDPPLRGGEELQEDGADAVVLHGQDLRGVTLFWGTESSCQGLPSSALACNRSYKTSAFVQTMYHYTDILRVYFRYFKGTLIGFFV